MCTAMVVLNHTHTQRERMRITEVVERVRNSSKAK